jgi:site-specific DNA-methyltransferase (adenine-specific)
MTPTEIEPPETPAEALSLAGIASTNLLSSFYADDLATVYLGEACAILRQLPTASVDVVITDPPYSSGGMMRGDRAGADCRSKYQQSQTEKVYDEFSGDNRDQRSFIMWCSIWLDELRRVTKPGAVIACFTDWRQMPAMTDALQVGGLVWRGVVPWVKKSYRPQKGRWASQCEYLVWGTNGPRAIDGPCFPGSYTYSVASDKRHMTEKPVDLMHELCRIAYEPDAVILDPFMGSGTTLKAAKQHGKRCIGIELTRLICETACERLREPVQHDLLDNTDYQTKL